MQSNDSAVHHLKLIMKSKSLKIDQMLTLIELLNTSESSNTQVVTLLEDIFKHEKSNRILLGVHVLEYLIKNCNRWFHEAANRESFQKSILGLLKRVKLPSFSNGAK
jgi:hypothetical protein